MTRGAAPAPTLAIVVPCYNEEPVVEETAAVLLEVLGEMRGRGKIDAGSFLYFVDDGSRDRTWELVAALHGKDRTVGGLRLSRNVGHQNALIAGLLRVAERAECAISIDADLQDDVAVIPEMVDRYREGAEIVYGVRRERDSDTAFKKWTAGLFYRLMRMLGAEMVPHHADFRLLSKRALRALSGFRESNLFLRGIVPLLGFRAETVVYDRRTRFAGETKYPLRKMLSFAWEGITSFSVIPLRIVSAVGIAISLMCLILSAWVLLSAFAGRVVPGWASTVLPIFFLGGVQLVGIGLIGEYVGKIYKEVKGRPRFIMEEELP
jgi:polyisoprenyl-phosphate glycosyltransferase